MYQLSFQNINIKCLKSRGKKHPQFPHLDMAVLKSFKQKISVCIATFQNLKIEICENELGNFTGNSDFGKDRGIL
jgi:hypothetical protein